LLSGVGVGDRDGYSWLESIGGMHTAVIARTSVVVEKAAVFISTDERSFAIGVFLALTMTMRTGIGGGATGSPRLRVQELLVAEVVIICAAVVVEIPAHVFLRKEAKLKLTVVVSTFERTSAIIIIMAIACS